MLRFNQAGAKLDETPAFHQWLKYVDMYRTKKGNHWFGDSDMVQLLQTAMREEDLVALLHSLRQVPRMKDHAETMQRFVFLDSKSNHRLMNGVWLKSHELPEEVYKILKKNLAGARMDAFGNNALFVQWLRYTKINNGNVKNDMIFGGQTVNFLHKTRPLKSEWEFSTLFQVMTEVPDLKRLAENMQLNLFQEWLPGYDPKLAASYLAIPYPINVVMLPSSDPRFKTWEAYALYFAESTSGKGMLGKVKAYFADGDPSGALTALMKSQ
ncbi:hypothetical protein PHYPSEUDO_012203 [Phytophthora pseudosyringae]|uniref:RXLR phytopathogen effector protein WY-domain domain-containing protein n=1 Tax=Phytophthora pseudosyringae TaxID=221518 RepID=A0A8T1W5M0_9STRA|nr:hypothetical protein PHYPSEUDO_012203 [Phytophthora pseudosyringae]